MKQHRQQPEEFFSEKEKLKKKTRIHWIEFFLAWVFLEAILFSGRDIFASRVSFTVSMFFGSVVILLFCCVQNREKAKKMLHSGLNLLCLAGCVLFFPRLAQALLAQCNQIISLWNRRFDTEIARFSADSRAESGLLILWGILGIFLARFLLRQLNLHRLRGIISLLFAVVSFGFVVGNGEKMTAVVFILLAVFSVLNWYSMPDKKIGVRQITLFAVIIMGVSICLVFRPQTGIFDEIIEWKAQMSDSIEEMRYGSDTLPHGNFSKVSGLLDGDEERLRITVSQPVDLYLKGFVGGTYHSSQWEALPVEAYQGNYEGMLSWLEDQNFVPVTQYAKYRKLTAQQKGSGATMAEIRVHNIGAYQKYIYLPASVQTWNAGYAKVMRDSSVASRKFLGAAKYQFEMSSGQQTAEKITQEGWLESAASKAQKEYLEAESVYHAFVQECYTAISAQKKQLIETAFFPDGTKGLNFNQITAQIRSVLRKQVTYTDIPQDLPKGNDELSWFLRDYQKGNAVSYATAAVFAYRAAGYPARYAEGYHISEKDIRQTWTQKTKEDEIVLTTGNAHAWAEVYISGVGWMPVEVVPGFYVETYSNQITPGKPSYQINASAKKDSRDTKQSEGSGSKEKKKEPEQKNKIISGEEIAFLILMVLYLVFSSYVILELQRVYRRRSYRKKKEKAKETGMLVAFYAGELEAILLMAKIYKTVGYSEELWYNMKQKFPGIESYEYERVIALLQKAQFGGAVLHSWELRMIDTFLKRLRHSWYQDRGFWQKIILRYRDAY